MTCERSQVQILYCPRKFPKDTFELCYLDFVVSKIVMKKQVLVVHGGETFKTYDEYLDYLRGYELDFSASQKREKRWKDLLQEDLGDGYQVILSRMPCPRNAKYLEWKIWIEKYFPYLTDDVVLIGHSLGGIFWLKYLNENEFPVGIGQVHLIAPPFGDKNGNHDYLDGFVLDSEKLKNNVGRKLAGRLFFYHSLDDPIVPFTDMEKYKKLLPGAKFFVFQDKGHFITDDFPEIVENIKKTGEK